MSPYLILHSEWHRIHGREAQAIRCIEKAVEAARGGEVMFYEALANEVGAALYLEKGATRVGMLYMREALFVYQNWGATAKVEQILKQYPELKFSIGTGGDKKTEHSLDFDTVLKATNSLMSEIHMPRLIEKLLAILIENAGAERGVLVLEGMNQPEDVPRSVLDYVKRTKETLVLENASTNQRFQRDDYLRSKSVASVICAPILSKGEMKGMVYLENNAAPGVFTEDRVETIRILAGQAAVSLENARLYEQQAEKIRMENELITAQAVQERLFPDNSKEFPGVSISGFYKPATECGGDWWYYSEIGEWVYVWIGDATGHGAPAALVTSAACSAVSIIEKMKDVTPESAMGTLNTAVFRSTKGQMNMTFFVGAMNKVTGEFRYSRASHEPPFFLKAGIGSGQDDFVKFRDKVNFVLDMANNGPPLGAEEDAIFKCGRLQFEPGDQLILYSDGLVERTDSKRAWGERGLINAIKSAIGKSENSSEVVKTIMEESDKFGGNLELADDITICVIKYTGQQADKKAA